MCEGRLSAREGLTIRKGVQHSELHGKPYSPCFTAYVCSVPCPGFKCPAVSNQRNVGRSVSYPGSGFTPELSVLIHVPWRERENPRSFQTKHSASGLPGAVGISRGGDRSEAAEEVSASAGG